MPEALYTISEVKAKKLDVNDKVNLFRSQVAQLADQIRREGGDCDDYELNSFEYLASVGFDYTTTAKRL